jgi:hypothetical protein
VLPRGEVLAMLEHFADRGAIVALPAARERRPLPDSLLAWIRPEQAALACEANGKALFTDDEEAFFAAPIPVELPWDPEPEPELETDPEQEDR